MLSEIGAVAQLIEPDPTLPEGWDLADAEAEGWDAAQALSWIGNRLGERHAA
jgi:hypothetical protein